MARSIHDTAARAALRARIGRLDPTASPRWGKFTAPKMVSHLIDAVRMALGDVVIPRRRTMLSNPIIRYLIIHVVPFPKGAPTARQLLERAPDTWASDIATLGELIERAASHAAAGVWQPHPAFGVLSARDWGVLIHKHIDHHLTQFGA